MTAISHSGYSGSISTLLDYSFLGSSSSKTNFLGSSSSNNVGMDALYSALISSNSYGTNTATESSKDVGSYMSDIKSKSSELLKSLSSLAEKGSKSMFDKYSATSSDAAVSVSYDSNTSFDDFKVNVKQLATAQVNTGASLKSNEIAYNSTDFAITLADGTSHTFEFNASDTATNLDIQENLARKINESDIGVKASVVKDSKTGTSQLVLESSKTGIENSFTVSGGLAGQMGLNDNVKSAQDSIYSIDNELFTSSSNSVELENGVKLTFNKTTDKESAIISSSLDSKETINNVRNIVNNFNQLLEAARDFNDSGAKRLVSRLEGLMSTYSGSLSKVGITKNDYGYLQIDEDKMQKAADNGNLKAVFNENNNGYSTGFANRLTTLANQIERNPEGFLSSDSKREYEFSNIKNPYTKPNTSAINRHQQYYNLQASGMLFSALF